MKILHICNDFCGSKVHMNLYSNLDRNNISQVIYSYMNNASFIGKNKFDSTVTKFVYSPILNKYNRMFYPYKEYLVYNDLKSKIEVKGVTLSHATTLYSDGGIAYRLFKEFSIPYVVAVRATDISTFMKIPFYWKYGKEILTNASKIIFISNRLREAFVSHKKVQTIMPMIEHKFMVIPNGIDKFWHDNICTDRRTNHEICYIGTFLPRKNVLMLIDAVNSLSEEYADIKLNIIGKGGIDEAVVLEKSKDNKHVNYVGPVFDKNELIKYLRSSSIFAMVSVGETFGLVYIEALSQNNVLIYTKNDGIDGIFTENIGEAIKPDINNVAQAIKKIFDNYNIYKGNQDIDFDLFNWDNIARKYIQIYSSFEN